MRELSALLTVIVLSRQARNFLGYRSVRGADTVIGVNPPNAEVRGGAESDVPRSEQRERSELYLLVISKRGATMETYFLILALVGKSSSGLDHMEFATKNDCEEAKKIVLISMKDEGAPGWGGNGGVIVKADCVNTGFSR